MADQTFQISSGFFNSVNGDRVYTADDMCKPYDGLVSDGVIPKGDSGVVCFHTVITNVNSRIISVAAGRAIMGGRWVEMTASKSITCPANPSANPRLDSVILQVSENSRLANLVYRTGTAAASPTAPALSTAAGITEIRLYNVRINSNGGISNLDDQRTYAAPYLSDTVVRSTSYTTVEGAPDDFVILSQKCGKVVTVDFMVNFVTPIDRFVFKLPYEPDPYYYLSWGDHDFPPHGIMINSSGDTTPFAMLYRDDMYYFDWVVYLPYTYGKNWAHFTYFTS